jgi:urease accessory protein UreH
MSGESKLRNPGGIDRFVTLQGNYPVKYILPRKETQRQIHAPVYARSFGGGLVSKDGVHVEVIIEADCSLCYMTQASQKGL